VRDNSLAALFGYVKQRLTDSGIDQAGFEAWLLLEWACAPERFTKPSETKTTLTRKDIFLNGDQLINQQAIAKLEEGLERRLGGESIHRIRGEREFYGLIFHLSPDTLEPRPDSETLIDLVLPLIEKKATQNPVHLLDMGTGSGALAIALLSQIPQLYATAVDIAAGALETAMNNARLHGVEDRFKPLLSDGFAEVRGKYDFIISNPPYIARSDIPHLDKRVRDFDPLIALDGGADGLDFYRLLASLSRQFLFPTGQIAVEIGQGQDEDVAALFEGQGFLLTSMADDLAGIHRALLFDRKF